MSHSLSRSQAFVLGLVVLTALVLGGLGLARIAEKQGLWADTVELTAGFPEAHDVDPGTPVRIRGVEAGEVVAIEYPDHDGPGAEVQLRMRLDSRFASRLYADATARIQSSGLLGGKVIAINPGKPERGPLAGGRFTGQAVQPGRGRRRCPEDRRRGTRPGLRDQGAGQEIRESNGTLMKLIRDDDLYQDVKGLIAKTDNAVESWRSRWRECRASSRMAARRCAR